MGTAALVLVTHAHGNGISLPGQVQGSQLKELADVD